MHQRLRTISITICLLAGSNLGWSNPDQEFITAIEGDAAQRLFEQLDERLIVERRNHDEVTTTKKVGWSISCTHTMSRNEDNDRYHCQQKFFDAGYTGNVEGRYDIPAASSGAEVVLLPIYYKGNLAQEIFAAATLQFPGEIESCSADQDCGYDTIIRGLDLTCYAKDHKNNREYWCHQYLQNLEGFAIPGGGDPMIGVVLGALSLGEEER
jgi:hypothetical protein